MPEIINHEKRRACSAFTHVTACTLAKSPSDSLHQRLQQSRCLHCCSGCYRVERTSSRAGIPPRWTSAFHGAPGTTNQELALLSMYDAGEPRRTYGNLK